VTGRRPDGPGSGSLVSQLVRGDLVVEQAAAARPFALPGAARRLAPFGVTVTLAWASAWLARGPASVPLWAAGAALSTLAGLSFLAPWRRLPPAADIVPVLAFVAATAMLVDSVGGVKSGLVMAMLVPVAWTALYHRRSESRMAVVAVVAALLALSVASGDSWAVIARRIVLWGSLSAVLSESIQALRHHLTGLLAGRDQLLLDANALGRAARDLEAALDPLSVVACASRQAAEMASSPATGVAGGHAICEYVLLDGDVARVLDGSGLAETGGFRLEENPYLADVVAVASPRRAAIMLDELTPRVRSIVRRLGLTHAAFVPVKVESAVHGVIAVLGRGGEVSEPLFERLIALGSLTELALRRALDYEVQRQQATTDPLTGLPNRQAFREWHYRRGGRRPFAILAIDLDGLGWVNDELGPETGDRYVTASARALCATMRQGVILARFGGDQFAALVFDAAEGAGCIVAARMLSSLAGLSVDRHPVSASIGLAVGRPGDDPDAVFKAADGALLEAKERGGMCFVLADEGAG